MCVKTVTDLLAKVDLDLTGEDACARLIDI